MATAAALSKATITPKIAIQDFSEERLWRKLWKSALKNDPLWELVYLLIVHLCIPVPTSFPDNFLGTSILFLLSHGGQNWTLNQYLRALEHIQRRMIFGSLVERGVNVSFIKFLNKYHDLGANYQVALHFPGRC